MKESDARWRLVGITLVLGVILGMVALAAREIFLASFGELERQDMVKNVERVRDSLNEQLLQLDATNGDYSGWDDACRFVRDGDPAFVEANLDTAIYAKLRLNLLAYFDNQGLQIYRRFYDYRHGREIPLPENLQSLLKPGGKLLQHADNRSFVRGVLSLPGGPMLVSARPVLASDYRGPVRGTLVTGRILDDVEVSRLAQITQLKVSIIPVTGEDLPDDIKRAPVSLAADETTYVQAGTEGQVEGSLLFRDIFGRESFLVRVETPRLIFQQGSETINYFILWCLAIGIGAVIAIQYLAERLEMVRRRGREIEKRYRSVVEHAAEGILLFDDTNYEILEVNPFFASYLGYAEAELTGRSLLEFMRLSVAEAQEEFYLIQQQEKREFKFLHRDGTILLAEVCASRIPFRERQVLCLMVHDLTLRKELEYQSMRAAQMVAIGELASGIAHEINNPITGVINYAQLLQQKPHLTLQDRDILARIVKEGGRIAQIVHSLLFFARDSGKNKSRLIAQQLLAEALTLAQRQLEKEGIELVLDLADTPLEIYANPQQVEQVWLNLISNARHAFLAIDGTTGRNKELHIAMQMVESQGRLLCRTTFFDNGTGIPAQMLNHVLKPFFTTKPAGMGTGLGLSISLDIVKSFGGELTIDSREGEYTLVTVDFPLVATGEPAGPTPLSP